MKKVACIALMSHVVAVPSVASAGLIEDFFDRNMFEQAVDAANGVLMIEDFNDSTLGTIPVNSPTSVGAFAVTHNTTSNSAAGFFQITETSNPGVFAPDLINDDSDRRHLQLRITPQSDQTIKISFDFPIIGFGATFNSINIDTDLTFSVFGENVNLSTGLPPASTSFVDPRQQGGFFGVVSTMPFTEVHFDGDIDDTFALDDAAFAKSDVPEPSAMALVLGGLAAAGLLRRRRSQT